MKHSSPHPDQVGIEHIAEFDAIVDVRSPAEFALDHVPGAVNFPVLDDQERAQVGTLYKQVSMFDARKLGAALVAQNIARHLLTPFFTSRERGWRPLIYCWRGGMRSGSMTHVLRQIGWHAAQLDGGYKSFRTHVVAGLATLPGRYSYRVICGETGSGKSRLLRALAKSGAQVLDLEAIARHRGSVLGNLPGSPQPSQKAFDTALWHAMSQFDAAQPVFVEAESKKIGAIRLPDSLVEALRTSRCLKLKLAFELRVGLLIEEYAHFFQDPDDLRGKLDGLTSLHGRQVVEGWRGLIQGADWHALVADLLTRHYDPAYGRSTGRNFPQLSNAIVVECVDPGDTGMLRLAGDLLKSAAREEIPA